MATILRFAFILLLSTMITTTFGQGVEKTLVKSFNLEGISTVHFDVEGLVEIKTWDNELLRVQMTITAQNSSENVLKSLISSGRYNLKADHTAESFVIRAPVLQKEVMISGKKLEDVVSFIIFAPKNVAIKLRNSATTAKDTF